MPALLGPDGAVKGDVWTFVTPGGDFLKVDLALRSGSKGTGPINPATAKAGWTAWADQSWYDIYMHDWVRSLNIGDSGINTAISTVYDGEGGLKVYDMCICSKAGDNGCGGPSGSPVGDPIANSWYYQVDHVNAPSASLVLCLKDLPPGEYWMTSYHNYWEPNSGSSRECTRSGNDYGQGMQFVRAMSAQQANDYYQGAAHNIVPVMTAWAGAFPDTGGVTSIADQMNVMPTHVTSDTSVKTSLIKFATDGSPVMVAYEPAPYQDTGDQYKGPRGILNAFHIQAQDPVLTAGFPRPADGSQDIEPSADLQWEAGALAVSHNVYIGTDATAVANATTASSQYKGSLPRGTESYNASLGYNRTYYWRIDEVGADGTVWPGAVWSFITGPCTVIEDFEAGFAWTGFGGSAGYVTRFEGECLDINIYGHCIGYPHAMQLEYYNAGGFTYSEAGRTFDTPQNWASGNQTLGLYFWGKAGNASDTLYVRVEDADEATAQVSQNPNLASETVQALGIPFADLAGVDLSRVTKLFIGLGQYPSGAASGATSTLFVDDISLCRGNCVPASAPSQDLNDDCIVNFEDHAVKASGWGGSMLQYKALAEQWLEETLIWP